MARLRASVQETFIQNPNYRLTQDSDGPIANNRTDGEIDSTTLIRNFVRHKKKQAVIGIIIFAIGINIHLLLALALSSSIKAEWLVIFCALIGLTMLKHLVLAYRVRKGWFGNNSYEAIQLLRFAIQQQSSQ